LVKAVQIGSTEKDTSRIIRKWKKFLTDYRFSKFGKDFKKNDDIFQSLS